MKVVKNCENDGVVMRSKMMAFFQKKQQQKLEENVERKSKELGVVRRRRNSWLNLFGIFMRVEC